MIRSPRQTASVIIKLQMHSKYGKVGANPEAPPMLCPYCLCEVRSPVKVDGKWTWDCLEGCNP